MKKNEFILLIIALIAIALFIFQVPGTSLLLTASLLILSLIYFITGLLLFNNLTLRQAFKGRELKNVNSQRKIGAVLLGIGLSSLIVQILFYAMIWPYSKVSIIAGLLIVLVGVCLLLAKQKTKAIARKVLSRSIIIVAISIFPLVLQKYQVLEFQYRNYPDYYNALVNAKENPSDEELWKKVDEERFKMQEKKYSK